MITLPNELLLEIGTYLDIYSLNASKLVCRSWNRIMDDQEIWDNLILKGLNFRPEVSPKAYVKGCTLNNVEAVTDRLKLIFNQVEPEEPIEVTIHYPYEKDNWIKISSGVFSDCHET